jgi:hypothetical protein
MKKYLPAFLAFILLIAGIIAVSFKTDSEEIRITWIIYFYFSLLTILFHFGIVRTTQARPQVFIRYYMAATTIKLLLHLGVIVIYCLFHKEMAVRFILTFMVMYLLFTVFEVIFVWRKK